MQAAASISFCNLAEPVEGSVSAADWAAVCSRGRVPVEKETLHVLITSNYFPEKQSLVCYKALWKLNARLSSPGVVDSVDCQTDSRASLTPLSVPLAGLEKLHYQTPSHFPAKLLAKLPATGWPVSQFWPKRPKQKSLGHLVETCLSWSQEMLSYTPLSLLPPAWNVDIRKEDIAHSCWMKEPF